MDNARWLLPATALLLGACATIPPPAPSTVLTSRSPVETPAAPPPPIVVVEAPPLVVDTTPTIPIPEHHSIRAALNLFTTEMREGIQASLIRSGRYKKMIDAALAEYRLPRSLAYLPVIESAYIPSLTSHAGAHGIWQFMPETAHEYGLRVDWWIDERADPEKSAHAAAAYLNDLYREFNDWPLALAAYNAGSGRIHRAMDSTGSTTFWELLDFAAIPKETRGYVATFYATLLIVSDPDTYGFRLGTAADPDDAEISVEGPLSLAYLAEISGISRDELRDLNPSLRRGLVPPGRTTIHVPIRAAEVVSARATTMKNDDAKIAVCTFTLREGDTLKRLARAIGTSADTIMAMNALRSSRAVGEGDSIYLPVRARDLGALLAGVYYKVRRGDTVYAIAKHHGLTVEELRELNSLSRRAKLHPGQRLRVAPPRVVTAGN